MAVSAVLKRSLVCCALLVLLSCSLLGQAESLIKRRSSDDFDTDLEEALAPKTPDSSSRLLLKIYDAVVQDAIERGATSQEVDGLLRKRSGLRKCFFHAVNCW